MPTNKISVKKRQLNIRQFITTAKNLKKKICSLHLQVNTSKSSCLGRLCDKVLGTIERTKYEIIILVQNLQCYANKRERGWKRERGGIKIKKEEGEVRRERERQAK